MKYQSIPVLGDGYVRLVETPWGRGDADLAEAGIIEAARQSTQGSFRGWDTDAKLLKHLYNHNHATPFEFAGMVIEVQAPIFVFREWHRHRTQSYNEMSARYAPLPEGHYTPTISRCMAGNSTNKQAGTVKGAGEATEDGVQSWLDTGERLAELVRKHYTDGLADGIPKEVARYLMPVGQFSRMRAAANLRNWLAFMTLRSSPDAQWEIRQYSIAVGQIVAEHFPQTWELFSAASEVGHE